MITEPLLETSGAPITIVLPSAEIETDSPAPPPSVSPAFMDKPILDQISSSNTNCIFKMFLVISSVNFYDEFDNGMTFFGETIFKISNLLMFLMICVIC